MTDLTNVELFKDLTTIDRQGTFADLHNDFICVGIHYVKDTKSVDFLFESGDSAQSKTSKLCLCFKDAIIVKFDLFFARTEDSGTLNNFYRGRFEENDALFEYSSAGEAYYYIEFEKGDRFELFAKEVILFEV